MYDKNNIFAKILRKEIPCEVVYEDNQVLFFYDINPQAKVHILGIPKKKEKNASEHIQKYTIYKIKTGYSYFSYSILASSIFFQK